MSGIFPHKAISLLRNIELVIFPSHCRLCSAFLDLPREKIVCSSCWTLVKAEKSAFCLSCGRFFEGAGEPHFCASCLQESPPFRTHRSFGRYRGRLKDILLLSKFHNLPILAEGLAQRVDVHLACEDNLWWGLDAVIPVPLHPKKQRARGYNLSQIIAQKLARYKGVALLERNLIKVKNLPPQMSLAMVDRLESVKGAFAVKESAKVEEKVLLLVDDVYTTGATIRECSSVLMTAGAKEVRAITVAQA